MKDDTFWLDGVIEEVLEGESIRVLERVCVGCWLREEERWVVDGSDFFAVLRDFRKLWTVIRMFSVFLVNENDCSRIVLRADSLVEF